MPLPTPTAAEEQAEFVSRCHEALSGEFPETDQRNAVCFRQWRESKGTDKLEKVACEKFPEDKFERVSDVPVFAEHATKDGSGNAVVYGKDELAAIAARCNERIADTGDFSPITEGHTPTKEDFAAGAPMPKVLGYAGPYRLGQIGNKNPRWAIFADEWHHKEDAQTLSRLRRRSPELWLEDRMEDRFFDPIAALGAETPRLDMGMVSYHRTADGRTVQKYSAASPAVGSVFVPSDDIDKKNHAAAPVAATGGLSMALTPEDVKQIVDAIEQLDWVQYVKADMASQQAEGSDDENPVDGIPDEAPPGEKPAPEEEKVPADPKAEAPKDGEPEKNERPVEGDTPESEKDAEMNGKKSYAADGTVEDPATTAAAGTVSKFAKESDEKARYAKLEARVQAAEEKVAKAEARERTADRYSKLTALRMNEGYVFSMEDELKDATEMSDEQFNRHVDRIRANYQKAPVDSRRLPTPGIPQDRGSEDEKALYEKAKGIHLEKSRNGVHITWHDALREAQKESTATVKTH
jgi:hypothetical protein